MTMPSRFQPISQAFLTGLTSILSEKLYGVYLHGAVVFPETTSANDIDFHVILKERLSPTEVQHIRRLHAEIAQKHPPIGDELDCYYVLLADAQKKLPPKHQLDTNKADEWWALHRAHLLAGRCVVLTGPEPKYIFPNPSWIELAMALRFELSWIEGILDKYPDYCVLNLCRVMHSFETKDVVVTKRACASRTRKRFAEWSPLIRAAERSYDDESTDEDELRLMSDARQFFRFVLTRIRVSPHWIEP